MSMKTIDRRLFLSSSLLALLDVDSAWAEDVAVPVSLQAELTAKVALYDRNFSARAGGHVQVLILTKARDAQSTRVAAQIRNAFEAIERVAGLPHTETVAPFSSGADLAATCKAKKYAIVYVTPGLGDELEAIAKGLSGISVLSVSVIPGYVSRGMVLGFDMVSGKSKMLVNRTQARLQSVDFKAEMLKLMKVVA